MTTIDKHVRGLVKSLMLVSSKSHWSIPQQVTVETKAIIYLKKVQGGEQDGGCSGIFMKRQSDYDWSYPVALHFEEGGVRFEKTGLYKFDKADVLILINDQTVVGAFENFGQVGFNGNYQIRRGPVIGGSDRDMMDYVKAFSQEADLHGKASFAYAISNGQLSGCKLSDAIFVFRVSSNHKYYLSRNATVPLILQGGFGLSSYKEQTLEKARRCLSMLTDPSIDGTPLARQMVADEEKENWNYASDVEEDGFESGFLKMEQLPSPAEELPKPIATPPTPLPGEFPRGRRLSFDFS